MSDPQAPSDESPKTGRGIRTRRFRQRFVQDSSQNAGIQVKNERGASESYPAFVKYEKRRPQQRGLLLGVVLKMRGDGVPTLRSLAVLDRPNHGH